MDPDCIFCKIVAGELPNHTIYEDDNYLVFLDINPLTRGHAEVIPKKHYRWVWDHPRVGEYFEVAKKVIEAQKKAFDTDWVIGLQVGESVPHAHIQLVPRRDDDGHGNFIRGELKTNPSPEELAETAGLIRKELT